MRKLVVVGLLAMLCLGLAAAPALAHANAQKDPFHPVIDPNATVTGSTTPTTSTTTGGATVVQPAVGSEGLANTGADVTPWLAVAYGLLVLGGAAVVLARMYQPQPTRR